MDASGLFKTEQGVWEGWLKQLVFSRESTTEERIAKKEFQRPKKGPSSSLQLSTDHNMPMKKEPKFKERTSLKQ